MINYKPHYTMNKMLLEHLLNLFNNNPRPHKKLSFAFIPAVHAARTAFTQLL